VYPYPVLCVSTEVPETNREFAANRHQSKSHTLEIVKRFRVGFFVGVFLFIFFLLRELVATWETAKIQCRREESQEQFCSVRTQWVEQKSVSKFFIFYHSKSA